MGNIVEKSNPKIIKSPTINKIPNANGETVDMASLKEPEKIPEKINPNKNIDKIIPKVAIHVNFGIDTFLSDFPDKKLMNAGYNGRTQTAPNGAKIPAK